MLPPWSKALSYSQKQSKCSILFCIDHFVQGLTQEQSGGRNEYGKGCGASITPTSSLTQKLHVVHSFSSCHTFLIFF